MSDELKAGRELDIMVAEKVMGFTLDYEFDEIYGRPTVKALRTDYNEEGLLPDYSTRIDDAWEVIEKISERGYNIRIERQSRVRVSIWKKNLNEYGPAPVSAVADTAPLAICLAALKVIE